MLLADRTSCTAASSLPCWGRKGVLQHPARAAGEATGCAARNAHGQPRRCRCANSRRGSRRSSNLSRRGCEGCCSFSQAPRRQRQPCPPPQPRPPSPQRPAPRHAPPPARLVQEALHVTGPAYDLRRWLRRARTGQHIQADVLSGVLKQLRAEGLRGCEPRGPCAYEVRLSAVCSAAQTARDGGRPLPVAGQGAGLRVSRQVVLNKAGSAVAWYLCANRTSSSVASAGVRKPSSGCRGVCCRGQGLGSSLDCTKSSRWKWLVTNEVALRSGWSRGSGSFRSR